MNNIILLIIFHVIGDFYLQSESVAKDKKNLNRSMLIHALIYSIPFFIFFFYIKKSVLLLIIVVVSHLIIDICSVRFKNKYKDKECLIFCIDQLVHVILIAICSVNISLKEIPPSNILALLLAIIIINKPIGIFISLALNSIFKCEKDNSELKIGRYIGYLERIIIFLLCIFNSVSTIGFVITAKTLVRYKDIHTNENNFQEKYLIGTLLSTIGALCCFALVKYI